MTSPSIHVSLVLPVLQPAGAERVVADLARRLPQHGFAVSVICLEDEQAPIGRELIDAGVRVIGLRTSRRNSLRCAKKLAAALPIDRPLVVHSHLFHANLAARLAIGKLPPAQRPGVAVINTIHVAERRFRPWQFMLDRLTADRATAEVCVSKAVAVFQQHKTGLPAAFFPVIENGIDLSRFTPGDGGDPNHVVSLGRLDPQKNYPTLLTAWRQIETTHPAARLTIAGRGPEEQRLKSQAKALGLSRVSFAGFVNDAPALLRSAVVYVQPSAWEGFGLAVAEAMAVGLPVIVSDADSLPEVVRHGQTGLVVPKSDAGALAAAIAKLLDDRSYATKLGTAARTEANQRFSVDRMVADYAALYRSVNSGSSSPG